MNFIWIVYLSVNGNILKFLEENNGRIFLWKVKNFLIDYIYIYMRY